VSEPLVGVLPWLWLPSLDVSVDFSVLKLALDRLRSSLKLKREGAMESLPALADTRAPVNAWPGGANWIAIRGKRGQRKWQPT